MLNDLMTAVDRRLALERILAPPQEQVWREGPAESVDRTHVAVGWLLTRAVSGSSWRATGYHNHSFVPDGVLTVGERSRAVVCRFRLDDWFLEHDVAQFDGPIPGVADHQPGSLVIDLADGPPPAGELAGLLCITAEQLCAWSRATAPVSLMEAVGVVQ